MARTKSFHAPINGRYIDPQATQTCGISRVHLTMRYQTNRLTSRKLGEFKLRS
jgi:hypothetical protein